MQEHWHCWNPQQRVPKVMQIMPWAACAALWGGLWATRRADVQEDFGLLQLECFCRVPCRIQDSLISMGSYPLRNLRVFCRNTVCSPVCFQWNVLALPCTQGTVPGCNLVMSSLSLQFSYGMGCWVCFCWFCWWVLLLGFWVFCVIAKWILTL